MRQIKTNKKQDMEFKAEIKSYLGRYFATLFGTVILVLAFYLQSIIKGFSFYEAINKLYFSDFKLALFLLVIPFLYHVNSYLTTNKYPRLLKLKKSSMTFHFFKKPSLTLKYSKIKSLEYSKDRFKDFEFFLKNGEKKVIYPTIKKKEEAFKLIQQKILESQNKD